MHPFSKASATRFMAPTRQRSYATRLETWSKRTEVTAVRIVGALPLACCPACQEADGTVLPLDVAIDEQPLPHEDCRDARGNHCCCSYAPVFDD